MSTVSFDDLDESTSSGPRIESDYDLSENVAEDVVYVGRGNVIANEEQHLLFAFQQLTAWMRLKARFVNIVGIGPSSGGKTQTQGSANNLIPEYPDGLAYETTDASDNAMIDDDDWDKALLATMDEYDKISDPVREYMKSMAGEDGGYSKKRNVEDSEAEGGYSPVEVSSEAKPFQFLYAPEDKGGLDNELENRMFKAFVDDDKYIREAIGRKEAGHDHITVQGYDYEYVYPTVDAQNRIKQHISELDIEDVFEEGELVGRRGDNYVKMPKWVWYACRDIFNFSTTATNRFFGMIFNLIRASALLNHHERPLVEKEITIDDERKTVDAYLVTAQDVANVLSCQRTLLGTTHSLDSLKLATLDAVRDLDGVSGGAGTTLSKIKEHLEQQDASVPSKQKLRGILEEELAEGFYIKFTKNAGGPNGRATLYEWRDSGEINPPKVSGLQEKADRHDEELESVGCESIENPFADATDPIRGQPFTETVDEFADEFSMSNVERRSRQADAVAESNSTDASAFMSGDSDSDEESQATLGDVGGDDESDSVALGVVEEEVVDRISGMIEGDEEVFKMESDGVELEDFHIMGVIDRGESLRDASTSGTLLDPTHDFWSRDDKPDTWVASEADAQGELSDAFSELEEKGVLVVEATGADGFLAVSLNAPT